MGQQQQGGVGGGGFPGVRGFEECSGRGKCDRKFGVCECFAGYEGAACSRQACPTAVVTSVQFPHLDYSAGAAAAAEEAAWETEYGGGGTYSAPEASGGTFNASAQDHTEAIPFVSTQPCNGKGRCMLMGDLPTLAASGAKDWGLTRIQKCVCDAGFGGPDCSLRVCPKGSDPEMSDFNLTATAAALRAAAAAGGSSTLPTIASVLQDECDATNTSCTLPTSTSTSTTNPPGVGALTVFNLTLTLPRAPDYTGQHYMAVGSDDLVLTLADGGDPSAIRLAGSHLPTSARASGVWAGTPASAASITKALLAIPGVSPTRLSVAPPATPTGPLSLSVSYTITMAGAYDTLPALACAAPIARGCSLPGCHPRHAQIKALALPRLPTSIVFLPTSVLRSPALPPSYTMAPAAGTPAWDVSATLVLSTFLLPSSGRGAATPPTLVALYRWEGVAIGGVSVTTGDAQALDSREGVGAAAWVGVDTPLPPGTTLRGRLPGPFGLTLGISESDDMQLLDDVKVASGAGAGPWRLTFSWSLPTCNVTTLSVPTPGLFPVECSRRGLCDREHGVCQCFFGYEGAACSKRAEVVMI